MKLFTTALGSVLTLMVGLTILVRVPRVLVIVMPIMIAIFLFAAAAVCLAIPVKAAETVTNCNQHCQFETEVAKKTGVTKDTNDNVGFLEIDLTGGGSWQGSVLGTDSKSETKEGGPGMSTVAFQCRDFGIFSTVIQKHAEDGTLRVKVVKNGNVLRDGSTSVAYGLVTLAGQC